MKSKVFNSSVLYIIISRSWCTIPLGRNKRALKLLYCIQNRSVFNGTSWKMFIRHTFLRQWIFCANIWHDLDHNRPFHLDVMFSHFKSRGIFVEILQFFFFSPHTEGHGNKEMLYICDKWENFKRENVTPKRKKNQEWKQNSSRSFAKVNGRMFGYLQRKPVIENPNPLESSSEMILWKKIRFQRLILQQGSCDHLLQAKPSRADVFDDLPVFLLAEIGIFC